MTIKINFHLFTWTLWIFNVKDFTIDIVNFNQWLFPTYVTQMKCFMTGQLIWPIKEENKSFVPISMMSFDGKYIENCFVLMMLTIFICLRLDGKAINFLFLLVSISAWRIQYSILLLSIRKYYHWVLKDSIRKNRLNHKFIFISFIISMKYARRSVCLFINSNNFTSPTANQSVMESNECIPLCKSFECLCMCVCVWIPNTSQSSCWISTRSMVIQWSSFFLVPFFLIIKALISFIQTRQIRMQ